MTTHLRNTPTETSGGPRANLIIDLGGDGFADYPATRLAIILRDIAAQIENDGPTSIICRDVNGDTVGLFWIDGGRI